MPRRGQGMTLAETLDRMTVEGALYERLPDQSVRCVACGHRCLIREGRRGICQVRFNRRGELRVPFGYVAGLQCDPIEKKPFYHLLPGSEVMTFGMLGCDFHCGYCQNWLSSQALRDPGCDEMGRTVRSIDAEGIVAAAQRMGASVVASSYNEPLITSEWAAAVFGQAQQAGLLCAFVSNGNATPEALAFLRPYLSAIKIDLKSMRRASYRQLGGVLEHTLDTIQQAWEMGLWVEVVTLIVPGWNNSLEELADAARFLAGVSPDIPWHVTAFHKDYRMTEPDNASAGDLRRAAEIGQEAGLRYVYAGNMPGSVGEYENTYCPHCSHLLIERMGFTLLDYDVTSQGGCPECNAPVPGVWPGEIERQAMAGRRDQRWPRPVQ